MSNSIYIDFIDVGSRHTDVIEKLAGSDGVDFKLFCKTDDKKRTISKTVVVGPFLDLGAANVFQSKANEKLEEVK